MIHTVLRTAIVAVGLTAALGTPQAQATLILPGQSVPPNAQANPLTGTTILANTGVQTFNVALAGTQLIGTGQAWVVSGFSGNTFGAGALTFVYQVALTGGTSPNGITPILERITMSAFDGFSTDVGYSVTTAGQVIPPLSDRSINGNVIAFDYSPPTSTGIAVGQQTPLLIVNTNARAFAPGTLTVQNGLTANMNGYAPAVAGVIPEPSGIVMAGTAMLASLGCFGWRRRQSSRA